MHLITRCPACATLFKVVPDQLRIAEGWVRCGRCHEEFNASLHLIQPDAASPEMADAKSCLPAGVSESLPDSVLAFDLPEASEPTMEQPLQTPPQAAITEAPSFALGPTISSEANSLKMRVLLGAIGVMLMLGLAVQIVHHERHRLLAWQPQLKPWLMAFCGPLNCTLSALQQKDALVIDGATFTKITRNSYRLNFTIKNTSALRLAPPSLELTLTDASDQPVLRRIFTPTDLDLKVDTLAPGSEWSASLAILVNPPVAAPPIVGYLLYVFYS